jgi:hypothetical protein
MRWRTGEHSQPDDFYFNFEWFPFEEHFTGALPASSTARERAEDKNTASACYEMLRKRAIALNY